MIRKTKTRMLDVVTVVAAEGVGPSTCQTCPRCNDSRVAARSWVTREGRREVKPNFYFVASTYFYFS